MPVSLHVFCNYPINISMFDKVPGQIPVRDIQVKSFSYVLLDIHIL